MYNRYIPQPDGSYRRNSQQERPRQSPPPKKQDPGGQRQQNPCPPQEPPAPPPPQEAHRNERQEHQRQPACRSGQSVTGFLRQLLPRDFDTADLLIVLLLILMAGDSQEDQNTAMLTLALYLFM